MHLPVDWVRRLSISQSRSSAFLGGALSPVLASALVLVLLVSAQSFAASAYPPNVTASQSITLTVTGDTASADFATTGMSVSISGLLPGRTSSVNVTTQTLDAPSGGVLNVTSSGTILYYYVIVPLPIGVYNYAADPNAAVAVSVSNPIVDSECMFVYWDGSAWSPAASTRVIGTTITGLIPFSTLTGNIAVVKPPTISTTSASTAPVTTTSTSSPSSSTSVTLLAVGGVVVVIIVAAGIMLMRGRRKT